MCKVNIKEGITDPVVLPLCTLNCLPKGLQVKFSIEKQCDLLVIEILFILCYYLDLNFTTCTQ